MIHKKSIRAIAGALVAVQLFSTAAFADLGELLDSYTVNLREETDISYSVYWSGTDYRRENYIEYSPNELVTPVIVYGSKLLNYGSFSSMAELLNGQDYYVIGGINGDFYNTWNYQPLGIVVSDGELISSDSGFYGVGFNSDGSAVVGKPELDMRISFRGETFILNNLNKVRMADHSLYTSDYASATNNSGEGTDIILSINDEASITLDCEISFTVEEIIKSDGSVEIPDGKYVLSLPDTADEWRLSTTEMLEVGDIIDMTVTCNEDWQDVQWAVGTIYSILEDGEVVEDLETGAAPRTAVGVREDGSCVLYTIDGRSAGYSVGATMTQVAERLKELGCVDAVMMDGGGSTTLNAVEAGYNTISQINTPSDGSQRSVTNYIMLVSQTLPTEETDRLVLYPQSSQMLVGASLELTVRATDEVGFSSTVPSGLTYSADSELGEFEKTTFVATGAGEGEVSVSASGVTAGTAKVNIVESPDTITVKNQSTSRGVSTVELLVGESLDLTASASDNHLELIADDACFTWEASEGIGEIDGEGVFTASDKAAVGVITVTAGESVVEIPVQINAALGTYEDVAEDSWYYEAVKTMGELGLISGVSDTEFAPDISMTRAMLVTVLHRMAGTPEAETAHSFGDVADGMWYSEAVAWASENGLVTGYDETTFGINDSISREQMATLLARYAVWTGLEIEEFELPSSLPDGELISSYAVPSVAWAMSSGLITGMEDGSFAPQDTATRAQVAVLLGRFLDSI